MKIQLLFCGLELFSILEIVDLSFRAPVGSPWGRVSLHGQTLWLESWEVSVTDRLYTSFLALSPFNYGVGVWGITCFAYLVLEGVVPGIVISPLFGYFCLNSDTV